MARLSTLVVGWMAVVLLAEVGASPPLVEELLARTKMAARDLTLTGSAEFLGYEKETKQFSKKLGSASFKEILEVAGKGRMIVDFDSYVIPWEEGGAPFLETAESISYNGSYFLRSVRQNGPQGKMHPMQEATLSASEPSGFGIRRHLLADNYLLFKAKLFESRTLTELLLDPSAAITGQIRRVFHVDVKEDTLEGRPCVRVDIQDGKEKPCQKESLFLDPARGFMVMKRVRYWDLCVEMNIRRYWEYITESAREVGPGVWLPTSMKLVRYEGADPVECITTKITSIALDAVESGETYTSQITPGATISDERFGLQFEAGESPAQLIEKIRPMVPVAK